MLSEYYKRRFELRKRGKGDYIEELDQEGPFRIRLSNGKDSPKKKKQRLSLDTAESRPSRHDLISTSPNLVHFSFGSPPTRDKIYHPKLFEGAAPVFVVTSSQKKQQQSLPKTSVSPLALPEQHPSPLPPPLPRSPQSRSDEELPSMPDQQQQSIPASIITDKAVEAPETTEDVHDNDTHTTKLDTPLPPTEDHQMGDATIDDNEERERLPSAEEDPKYSTKADSNHAATKDQLHGKDAHDTSPAPSAASPPAPSLASRSPPAPATASPPALAPAPKSPPPPAPSITSKSPPAPPAPASPPAPPSAPSLASKSPPTAASLPAPPLGSAPDNKDPANDQPHTNSIESNEDDEAFEFDFGHADSPDATHEGHAAPSSPKIATATSEQPEGLDAIDFGAYFDEPPSTAPALVYDSITDDTPSDLLPMDRRKKLENELDPVILHCLTEIPNELLPEDLDRIVAYGYPRLFDPSKNVDSKLVAELTSVIECLKKTAEEYIAQHPNPDSQQTADDIYIRLTQVLGAVKQGRTTLMELEMAFKKVVAALKAEAKRSLNNQMEHDKWRRRLADQKKRLEEKERKEQKLLEHDSFFQDLADALVEL
ncbi:hypothetical protein [Absidia glauca]|uniref:Uncharacterized protein n=1 Tax=Absidia glauca TaxID=4829 RepID=A0A168MAY0_ABSGL|nr:hypothetical protein [Absidia glauca]